MSNNVHTTGSISSHGVTLALHEMRERRRRHDTKLQVPRRVVAATIALFLSAGTLAVTASDELGPATAVVVLFGGVLLIITALLVESIADFWSDGPELTCILHEFPDSDLPDCPLDNFSNSGCTAPEIELHVFRHHEEDYNRNKRTRRTSSWQWPSTS